MPVFIRFKTLHSLDFQNALKRLNPRKNPRAVSSALRRSAELTQRLMKTKYLQGPRPRRLDEVTGEAAASVAIDESQLPRRIIVGTPPELFWLEFHEFGMGRFPKRAFVEPSLDEAAKDIPEFFLEEWRKLVPQGEVLR